MRYTVSQTDSVRYSVVGDGPVFYGSRTACDRVARELNGTERCAILRGRMARAGAKSEFYRTWRAELDELEAELTARNISGCTCGDAYDSRIVDVPLCDYCRTR